MHTSYVIYFYSVTKMYLFILKNEDPAWDYKDSTLDHDCTNFLPILLVQKIMSDWTPSTM